MTSFLLLNFIVKDSVESDLSFIQQIFEFQERWPAVAVAWECAGFSSEISYRTQPSTPGGLVVGWLYQYQVTSQVETWSSDTNGITISDKTILFSD